MRKLAAKTSMGVGDKLMLTVEEAADMIGIGTDLLRRLALRKTVGSVKIGKRRLFPRIAVEQYVARLMRDQGVEVDA